ncbi:MAG: hypothetical protein GEU74_09480 [Nitriliruptorales bacterium]|nr:hypothetical protein [Nitriliruptorales bacterium]
MPAGVHDSLAQFARLWETKGVEAWHEDWLPEVQEVSGVLADLVGAARHRRRPSERVDARVDGAQQRGFRFGPQRHRGG